MSETRLRATKPKKNIARAKAGKGSKKATVLTIGHSTRALDDFIKMLQAHQVTCLVDVRTIPRSRYNPQFNADSLPQALKEAGIDYNHMPGLGGLRHASKTSLNTGWRNASFRGFADYMQSPEFERALEKLLELAQHGRPALMCAEAVPWRCHRSLIADALLVRGIQVEHIMSSTNRNQHKLTPFASVAGSRVTYPGQASPAADRGFDRPKAEKE